MQNNSDWVQCYPPKPKTETDNVDPAQNNLGYLAKSKFDNCFITHCI